MADCADDRGGCRSHRPQQPLVAEAEQVLEVTAPARDDDHIDVGVGIQFGKCRKHLGDEAIALHRRVAHLELDAWPAQLGVAQHVFLCVAVLAGDEADALGEEGEPLLARIVEEPLAPQLGAETLELLEQVAETDVAHARDHKAEVAALHPIFGLDARDHAVAPFEVGGDPAPDARPDSDADGRVAVDVAKFGVGADVTDVPLGDLALDPCGAELGDPIAHRATKRVDTAGRLGG